MTTEKIIENLKNHRLNVTLWTKKGIRLYVNDFGYSTSKCRQSIYIDLESMKVVCFTDCPSQPLSWIMSQNQEIISRLEKYVRYIRLISKLS